ncbi:solute carrier family 23 protein, partial [Streptomyces sp. NPDC004980]
CSSPGAAANAVARAARSRTVGGPHAVEVASTIFNQNVGAVAATRIYSRYVTAVSGAILVVLGLVPRIGEVVAAIPKPVVGGVGLVLFATVAVVGVNTLRQADLLDRVNATIAATAIGIGLLPELTSGMFTKFPTSAQILLDSGVTLGAGAAFLLNLIFHRASHPFHRARLGHRHRPVLRLRRRDRAGRAVVDPGLPGRGPGDLRHHARAR